MSRIRRPGKYLIFITAMKRYLIILIAFCCFSGRVCAQSPSAATDSLVKFHVIRAGQRAAFENELRNDSLVSHNIAVLRALYDIVLQKTFHINTHRGPIFVAYRDSSMTKKQRDSISDLLRPLLKNIKKAGLLTNRVYTSTLKGIDSNYFIADVQLVGHLLEMSTRLELLAPDKLLPVAEKLHQNGIVSDSSFLRLQRDINTGKIESAFQLNNYCSLDKTFDMVNYTGDTAVWLERLHRDMASMLPVLDFTNFKCTTTAVVDSSLGMGPMPETRFKVSLVCHGRTYKYANESLVLQSIKGKMPPSSLFAEGFFRIFNKILTDEHSQLRLHLLMFDQACTTDDLLRRFALIALRDSQAVVLMQKPCMQYIMASMGDYFNTLTSGRIDSAITEWKNIGLFVHLSDKEIAKATDDAETADLRSVDELLSYFPGVLCSSKPFAAASRYPYIDVLHQLKAITYGAFNPTSITQKKINSGIRLQYLFHGRSHSFTFKTNYVWFDEKFPLFLKQLGAENGLPGDFYQLPYINAVVYLTKQQYANAVKFKLLDFN